jgi:5'-phosphate synthase pdxT subunit
VKAGVLALQGDFHEHARVFAELGASPVEVRTPEDLARVDVLAIPGG